MDLELYEALKRAYENKGQVELAYFGNKRYKGKIVELNPRTLSIECLKKGKLIKAHLICGYVKSVEEAI